MGRVFISRHLAAADGPNVLFFGTIHGDEVCGYEALNKLDEALDHGSLSLLKGTLTLIPMCNPKAYAEKQRFIDENLNRVFTCHDEPQSYEAQLANELCALMPGKDYFIDFHSAPDTNKPFAIMDYMHDANLKLFAMTGLPLCITGWPELFKDSKSKCTTDEAERLGIPGLTIECGQHNDPESVVIGYQTAIQVLAHLGMINVAPSLPVDAEKWHLVHMAIKTCDGKFTKNYKQGDRVKAGELIVTQSDGKTHYAAQDGVLVMPDPNVPTGEAWFYLAEER